MTVESEIRRRLAKQGRVTFAEFMELALYWPEGGYYAGASNRIGSQGDFYTSPMVHPAFGGLISVQLFQMWQLLGEPPLFTVVEYGCGNGQLGRDILTSSQRLSDSFQSALNYVGVERQISAGSSEDNLSFPVVHPEAAPNQITGCVLSNELLDAFPVHQVRLQNGELREIYVALENEQLTEQLGPPSTLALADRLRGLGITLEEGQTAEINLKLADWYREVSESLDAGFVLTIDYGREARELYSPEQRMRGTFTTFYRHTQTDAPLRRVGDQDMTSQVDFTSAIKEGRRAGLAPLGLTTQERFLSNLGMDRWQRQLVSLGLPQNQTHANRAGMVDLVRAGGLGDFKVLIQSKNVNNVDDTPLWGLEPSDQSWELVYRLPTPLLTRQHLNLLEGRYSPPAIDFEEYWPPGQAA